MEIGKNSIYLTADEAREEIYEGEVVEKITGNQLRWGTNMESIVKIKGKFYCIDWTKAATEMQEGEIYGGEFSEVIQKERIVKVWVDKL